MGLGFTVGLLAIGIFREVLGAGTVFGLKITPANFEPASIFVLAPGAFFVLSMLTALQNKFKLPSATNGKSSSKLGCSGDCLSCHGSTCSTNREMIDDAMVNGVKKAEARIDSVTNKE
jgi:electron transport complex protein RnfE